jgi:hypothetical protein
MAKAGRRVVYTTHIHRHDGRDPGLFASAGCHATARDAFFGITGVFLSDATGAPAYLDLGQGGMSGDEVHHARLVVLSNATADVMSTSERAAVAGWVIAQPARPWGRLTGTATVGLAIGQRDGGQVTRPRVGSAGSLGTASG